jgi:small subunit ribosomal protein S13
MIYLLNTNIEDNKRTFVSLRSIFGVGKHQSARITKYIGISLKTRVQYLTAEIKSQIISYIENNIQIGDNLKQVLTQIKERQILLKSYKGQRLTFKLPRRGQRTHTNGKTVKRVK